MLETRRISVKTDAHLRPCRRQKRCDVAYLRHPEAQVGISVSTATPYLMNGEAERAERTVAENREAMLMLEKDYREASGWFGSLSFEDFAAGYQAMTDWYEQRSFSSKLAQEAVA